MSDHITYSATRWAKRRPPSQGIIPRQKDRSERLPTTSECAQAKIPELAELKKRQTQKLEDYKRSIATFLDTPQVNPQAKKLSSTTKPPRTRASRLKGTGDDPMTPQDLDPDSSELDEDNEDSDKKDDWDRGNR
ncbi:hypothetical protein BC827DRAFT_1158873 [Russula dissimulans]|nr:hypothetical protein BC827DRAFT_1158873 [Russula dissimulans]